MAELQQQSDARVAGLMSTFDKKFNDLQKKVVQSQRQLVNDDPEDPRVTELQEELDRVRREAEAERAGREYPDAFPVYKQILEASDATEQMRLLTEAINAARTPTPAPAAPVADAPAPVVEPPVPPVDPNNPFRRQAQSGDPQMVEIAGKPTLVDDNFIRRHLGKLPWESA